MELNTSLISVVIPVYNVKSYLEECVNSVLSQTYSNLEIILIDDGSTDGSGELCDTLKEKDKRIVVIHKKNAGLGYARNSGLAIFTGKYVTFLDSDDYITSTTIETLYTSLIENHVDECKMGFQRIRNDNYICGERKFNFEVFQGEKAKIIYAPRLIGSAPNKHDSIEMCVCGTLFNGDIIREHHLRFPSERELLSEDLFFHIEYLQYADGACTVENTDYKYRVNATSLTKSYKADRFEKSLIFYEEVVRRLNQYGYGKDEINRAKRNFFVYVRASISQEINYEKNSMRAAVKNIKKICTNEKLQDIIKSYPVEKLGFTQRVFILCIRYRMAFLLYVLKKLRLY